MKTLEIKEVMDREKIAKTINTILDSGAELLKCDKFTSHEHAKIKVIRTMGSHVNAAVIMVQQETAQARAALVQERMRQLGFNGDEPKQIKS
ncbi:MAG: hypothetical protein GTN82_26010 [Candidatus Aminicenantes bacterium]|nr:hypothetical protein [Candidatus Aminicenantes bacterium]